MTKRKRILNYISIGLSIFIVACNNTSSMKVESLKAIAFQEQITEFGSQAVLLDVRTAGEFESGFIEGAVNIDVEKESEFITEIKKIDKNKTIFVYCKSGTRTQAASDLLSKEGFEVKVLQQGLLGWRSEGMPLTTDEKVVAKQFATFLEEFDFLIKGEKLVMVDFYADWCRPCKIMEPDINQVKQERKGDVLVLKVNVDFEVELANRYNISSIPTLMLFKNNEILYSLAGVHSYQDIISLVEKYK
jgi:thioredoxin